MESQKNNLKYQKKQFINLAFEQAKINLGSTKTNPCVGCIIEKNGAVISSGFTAANGRPHAEYNALYKKGNFENANLYVTLEPCSHYGLTPPCTNIIIKKKIKKVFFSVNDPNPNLKNFKKILSQKGIITSGSISKKKGLEFYKSYYLQYTSKLPLIDAKLAISKDYLTKNLKSKFITNKHSIKRSHLIRSMYNCIISTSKSINEDNSKLDCRIEGLEEKSPDLVILDRNLKLLKSCNLLKNTKKRKIFLITSLNSRKKISFFKKKGVKIILMKSLVNKKDFNNLFHILKKKGYSRIFLESGLTLLNFLIKNNFISNIYIFKSKNNLNKFGRNFSSKNLIKNIALKNQINVNLFGDRLYKEKLK